MGKQDLKRKTERAETSRKEASCVNLELPWTDYTYLPTQLCISPTSPHPSTYLSIMHACMHTCMHPSIPTTHISIHTPIHLFTHPTTHPPIYPCTHIQTHVHPHPHSTPSMHSSTQSPSSPMPLVLCIPAPSQQTSVTAYGLLPTPADRS